MQPGALHSAPSAGEAVFARLAASAIVREAREAFREATGLCFELWPAGPAGDHGAGCAHRAHAGSSSEDFCELMARRSPRCRECVADARRLAAQTLRGPALAECFAGVTRAVVPVRAEAGALVAFLRSASVLVDSGAGPADDFERQVAPRALRRGLPKGELPLLRNAFEALPRLSPARHAGAVRLLVSIANHLALLAAALAPPCSASEELSPIERAKHIIGDRLAGVPGIALSLSAVAAAVGVSVPYFSTLFHRETGQTFSGYLAQARVERARRLLARPNSRIGSVAEGAGFRSRSQFNRTFRRLAGCSPREFRDALGADVPPPAP